MSIKIKSTTQEVQDWVDEKEIFNLLKVFGMINDVYVKTGENYSYNFKDSSKKEVVSLANQKSVKISTLTNYDSFYKVSFAA